MHLTVTKARADGYRPYVVLVQWLSELATTEVKFDQWRVSVYADRVLTLIKDPAYSDHFFFDPEDRYNDFWTYVNNTLDPDKLKHVYPPAL